MDSEVYRQCAIEMVNYIAEFRKTLHTRLPIPDVQPGYLRSLLPPEAPMTPDSWSKIMSDVENYILPGVTQWNSPHFHAYYPSINSFPSMLGDMLSSAIGSVSFSWMSSPACCELEEIIIDWMAQLIGLPEHFLSGGKGGGVIQSTASEATLVMLIAASNKIKEKHIDKKNIYDKLVAYTSDQGHSSIEKACLLTGVKCKFIKTNDDDSMSIVDLEETLKQDLENDLIPFYVVATLGTTSTCAFDNLKEIGPICKKYDIWLHIDAAYAGSAFICEEFRYLMEGIEYADSFNFNPHKWMLVGFDCAALWVKDRGYLIDRFSVDPFYLRTKKSSNQGELKRFQIPLGTRFRSLKVWFVLRLFGAENLKNYIRMHVKLAKEFATYVQNDDRFSLVHPPRMGLVCFKLKGKSNEKTRTLYEMIIVDRRIYVVPSVKKDVYFIRFAMCAYETNSEDIRYAWNIIAELTEIMFLEKKFKKLTRQNSIMKIDL